MPIRIVLPLAVSAAFLAGCVDQNANSGSTSTRFLVSQDGMIPAGVPCDRIRADVRDTIAGCETSLRNLSEEQRTRQAIIDLNEKFDTEVQTVINFDFDRDELRPDARAILDQQAAWIRQYDDVHFSVFGHTDLVGSTDYNFDLAKRRADAAVSYLVSRGVPAEQLQSVVSFGETRPIIQTARREETNRRAVTEVSGYLRLKNVALVPVACGAIDSSYVASYPGCIDDVDAEPDRTSTPPASPPRGVTNLETEYESRSGDLRGFARDTTDSDGNRTRESGGTTGGTFNSSTGEVDNPRTETSASVEETSSENTNTASWSGRAGGETVSAPENP